MTQATTVQTLIFSRSGYTPSKAESWARGHGYRARKVDVTDKSVRVRQHDPSSFKKGSLRTVTFGKGIKAVVGHLREENPKMGDALLWVGGGALLAVGGYLGYQAWKASQQPPPPPSPQAQATAQAIAACKTAQQTGLIHASVNCDALAPAPAPS